MKIQKAIITLLFVSRVESEEEPAPVPTPVPPQPCANNECNNAGECEVKGGAAVCVCEDTFENTASLDSCVCPEGTTRTTMNRCVGPPPSTSPSQETDSPTLLPSSTPTFAPSFDTDSICEDSSLFEFALEFNGSFVGCEWLTANSNNVDSRIAKYCGRADVKGACQLSCDNCGCEDNDAFLFSKPDGFEVSCSYISQNPNKISIRRNKFCFTDSECREASTIGAACAAACGFCDGSSTLGCIRTNTPTKSPTLCAPSLPTNSAPSKGYCGNGKGKGSWSRKKQR